MFIETERVGGPSARKKQLKKDRRGDEGHQVCIVPTASTIWPTFRSPCPLFLVRNLNVKVEELIGDQIVLTCGGSQGPQLLFLQGS